MSLEEVVGKIGIGKQKTAIDAVLKLMDEDSALMHTEINQPQVMNALLVAREFATIKNYPKTAKIWETIYNAQVVHMVSYKRQRPKELVKVLTSMMTQLGLQPEKTGLLGQKKQ